VCVLGTCIIINNIAHLTHSQTRQLYFVQESALHELFKFAAQYSEEITDGLNEEGLSIMATNFQQLKSSIPV
jgi:predicted choloylglycine hydrolase